ARRAGLEADGVAVVLGWFEREEQARRWSTSRRRGHTPNLVRVLPVRQALSRLPPSYVEDGASEPRQVVWVPRGATAYRFSDETDERGSVVRSTRTVACEVPKESVFEFAARQWRSHEPFAWMPVRCGADVAWVERAATSQESVSYVDSEGRIRVTQVTEVECDSPSYTTWEVDETGRRLNPQTEAGSCGEP
ncbi:MAG: hypothetical protein AB8I08_10970, partial [Sandaracinaceae bacterium]